jgi:hypothetical protein
MTTYDAETLDRLPDGAVVRGAGDPRLLVRDDGRWWLAATFVDETYTSAEIAPAELIANPADQGAAVPIMLAPLAIRRRHPDDTPLTDDELDHAMATLKTLTDVNVPDDPRQVLEDLDNAISWMLEP